MKLLVKKTKFLRVDIVQTQDGLALDWPNEVR